MKLASFSPLNKAFSNEQIIFDCKKKKCCKKYKNKGNACKKCPKFS